MLNLSLVVNFNQKAAVLTTVLSTYSFASIVLIQWQN